MILKATEGTSRARQTVGRFGALCPPGPDSRGDQPLAKGKLSISSMSSLLTSLLPSRSQQRTSCASVSWVGLLPCCVFCWFTRSPASLGAGSHCQRGELLSSVRPTPGGLQLQIMASTGPSGWLWASCKVFALATLTTAATLSSPISLVQWWTSCCSTWRSLSQAKQMIL